MNEPPLPAGSCPRCGSAWTFVNGQWLWKERSGAAYFLKEYRELNADGTPPPLKRCPGCKAKLESA